MVEQEKECAVEREYEQDDNLEQERLQENLESADQECGVGTSCLSVSLFWLF